MEQLFSPHQNIRHQIHRADAEPTVNTTMLFLLEAKQQIQTLLPDLYTDSKLVENQEESWLAIGWYFHAVTRMITKNEGLSGWEAAAYRHVDQVTSRHSPVRNFSECSQAAIKAARTPRQHLPLLWTALETYRNTYPEDLNQLELAIRRFLQISLRSTRYLAASLNGLALLQDIHRQDGQSPQSKLSIAQQIILDNLKNARKRREYTQQSGIDHPKGHEFAIPFKVIAASYSNTTNFLGKNNNSRK